MLASLFLFAALQDGSKALGRFEAYMKAHPALSVDFKVVSTDFPTVKGAGKYSIQRAFGQRLYGNWSGSAYEYRQNPSGAIEMVHYAKKYVAFSATGKLTPPEGEFSKLALYSFPFPLLSGRLTDSVRGASFRVEPPLSKAMGPLHLHARTESGGIRAEVHAWIDSVGLLLKYSFERQTAQAHFMHEFTFSNYRPLGDDKFLFEPSLPSGYVPFLLDEPENAPEIGGPMALGTWLDEKGKPITGESALGGKRSLIMVTDERCPVCSASLPVLRSLSAASKALGVPVIELTLGNAGLGIGERLYKDSNGSAEKAMLPPGTPSIYLVDHQGRLERLWFGVDADHPDSLSKEVIKVLEKH